MTKETTEISSLISNGHKSEDEEEKKPSSSWTEIEIVGNTRNLSPMLWKLSYLTGLYLRDNGITRIPAEIASLKSLVKLDLSKNKLRSLPTELGDMIELQELNLSYNSLRVLPNELGRLFRLKSLGLQGNPLPPEIMSLPLDKLQAYMLENLTGEYIFYHYFDLYLLICAVSINWANIDRPPCLRFSGRKANSRYSYLGV